MSLNDFTALTQYPIVNFYNPDVLARGNLTVREGVLLVGVKSKPDKVGTISNIGTAIADTTVATTLGDKEIVGSGTGCDFVGDLAIGDYVKIGTLNHRIAKIIDATHAELTRAATATATGLSIAIYSETLTGTGTKFTEDYVVGQRIQIGASTNPYAFIKTITSDTAMDVIFNYDELNDEYFAVFGNGEAGRQYTLAMIGDTANIVFSVESPVEELSGHAYANAKYMKKGTGKLTFEATNINPYVMSVLDPMYKLSLNSTTGLNDGARLYDLQGYLDTDFLDDIAIVSYKVGQPQTDKKEILYIPNAAIAPLMREISYGSGQSNRAFEVSTYGAIDSTGKRYWAQVGTYN